MKTCIVEDCIGKHEARGYCNKHYLRLKLKGKLVVAPYRERGTGTDWRLQNGYLMRWLQKDNQRFKIWQHREVMEQHLGRQLRADENVHHMNGSRSDNRVENLELWSTSQPYGQRVADKLAWAREIIALYGE